MMTMDAESGFVLENPTYVAREVAMLFTVYVRPTTVPTVYRWMQMWRHGDGSEGLENSSTPSGRYLVPAEALRSLLLKHGAKERE